MADPGATPIGYLTQRPLVLWGGITLFWARFPSAAFSICSCWAVFRVSQELRIPRAGGILATGIFMILPSQFRYATEGRPYAEAMFFSLLSTLAFVKLTDNPTFFHAALFALTAAAGLLTQPYAVLAAAGLSAWAAVSRIKLGSWKTALGPAICLALAAVMVLPWYLATVRQWDASIQSMGWPKFHWTFALAQDVAKGISGGSLICSAALITLAAVGLWLGTAPGGCRGMLLLATVFAIAGALAGDCLKNYFFAARQIVFALPALSILAAVGLSNIFERSKFVAIGLAGLLAIASLVNDITYQLNAKENWPAAATTLAAITDSGYCLEIVGDQRLVLYSVFVPPLKYKACGSLALPSKVAVVSDSYTDIAQVRSVENRLQDSGYLPRETKLVGGTRITLENR
jgi:uncharacterized membrane protein